MKGTIGYCKRLKRFYVAWYDSSVKRTEKIYHYQNIPLDTEDLANRLLTAMRADSDRGTFRMEKYIHRKTEVVPFLRQFIAERVENKKAPATTRSWNGFIKNHLAPYFEGSGIGLDDITFEVLMDLKDNLKVSDNSKIMIMSFLRTAMMYAKRLGRITEVPYFPRREDYPDAIEPEIKWITEDRQLAIINAMPEQHRPIFHWLRLHLRRPAEACALYKGDYYNDAFHLRRTFSGKVLHERTKVKKIIHIPCVDEFLPYLEWMRHQEWWYASDFMFINPDAYGENKNYNHTTLTDIFKKACAAVGETDITLYQALKHSGVSQMVNVHGYHPQQIMMALDCSAKVVNRYAKTELATRKSLLERKVVQFVPRNRNEMSSGGSQ
jgi:hypothetical protein